MPTFLCPYREPSSGWVTFWLDSFLKTEFYLAAIHVKAQPLYNRISKWWPSLYVGYSHLLLKDNLGKIDLGPRNVDAFTETILDPTVGPVRYVMFSLLLQQIFEN